MGSPADETVKDPKIHYAWIVMIAFGLVMSGTLGSLTVLAGLFVFPVTSDLGFDLSAFTMYLTATIVVLALAMPLVGNLLTKVPLQVMLTIAGIIEFGVLGSMSFFTEIWQWYIAGAISGVGLAATSVVTITPTMGNWFRKRTGLAIGVVWAMQSLFDALASPLIQLVIADAGWRAGYQTLACLSALLVLPCTVLIIRYRPEDKGMKPYGYDPSEVARVSSLEIPGVPYKVAVRSIPFFLCVALVMLCQLTSCMNQVFPTYAEVVGLGAATGALMVSAASICDIFLNPIAGTTGDAFGPTRAMLIWTGLAMLSFVILYLGSASPVASCIGAGINDAMYAICGVGYATFALSLFGMKDFERIFSRITSVGCLIASLGTPLMMLIFESTGDFRNVFVFCFAIDAIIIALTLGASKLGKALPR